MVVCVSQANFYVVAVAEVVPVAGRLWNLIPVLNSMGYFDVDVLQHRPFFHYLVVHLYWDFYVDLNFI